MRIEQRTGPGPTVPRKPRPGPCRRTARCGARRGPAGAPARSVPAGARRTRGAAGAGGGPPPPVERRAGQPQGLTQRGGAVLRGAVPRWPSWLAPAAAGRAARTESFLDLDDRLGPLSAPRSSRPAAARSRRSQSRGRRGSPSAHDAWASGRPASPSRCCRQVVRCDEYRPSRRSSAPTAPGLAHASASRRMRSLYSAVNRRRTGFSATCTSSGTTVTGPSMGCTPVSPSSLISGGGTASLILTQRAAARKGERPREKEIIRLRTTQSLVAKSRTSHTSNPCATRMPRACPTTRAARVLFQTARGSRRLPACTGLPLGSGPLVVGSPASPIDA